MNCTCPTFFYPGIHSHVLCNILRAPGCLGSTSFVLLGNVSVPANVVLGVVVRKKRGGGAGAGNAHMVNTSCPLLKGQGVVLQIGLAQVHQGL